MKTFITLMVMIFLFMGFVFLGMPSIIEKETTRLKSEVQGLQARIQTLEKFKQRQEDAWKLNGLKPDADFQKVIKTVNGLSLKIANLEDGLNKRIVSLNSELEKYDLAHKDSLKQQSEAINALYEELASIWKKIYLNSLTINIKTHIVGAKIELASRNIGNVKAELQAISEELQKVKNTVGDTNKKAFDDLRVIVENTKSELDNSLLGASNMINLLWYELDKTLGVLQ
ncbi:MAG: hypothetical protein PHU49_13985 [Syntrophorhabdaceae bacterium]|nr:hypothetical protein [Syntrophorhabdaceae bacterium]